MFGRKRFIMSANDTTNGKKPEEETKSLDFSKAKKGSAAVEGKKEVAVHHKRKVTAGWVFGMVILILIAVSFILAPAIEAVVSKKTSNGIVFGTYGKDEIKYAYGNYFYDQVQNYADQYKSSGTDQTQALYQIWQSAYNSTVLFTAINQIAAKAGIIATDETVNQAIISSGVYDKDGKFDVATYQKATAESKASVEKSIRRSLPYQTVVNDIGSVLSSKAEADYIAEMASKGRSFKYVTFDASQYPNENASAYALQNQQLFYNMDLSILSVSTEAEAKTLVDSITSGATTFEAAATANSLDSFAKNEGKVGKVYYFALTPNFKNADDATKILSAKAGDVIGPFESNNSWMVLKLNSDPVQADYASETDLAAVKAYMASNDSAPIDEYLASVANEFTTLAKNIGYEQAIIEKNLVETDVAATPLNIGASNYLNSFSNTDSAGLLATAASSADVAKQLYAADSQSILDPIKSGSSYIVVQAGEDVTDDNMGSYISMFYNYYSGSQNQQDFSQAVSTNEAFKDNFLVTFLAKILGSTK